MNVNRKSAKLAAPAALLCVTLAVTPVGAEMISENDNVVAQNETTPDIHPDLCNSVIEMIGPLAISLYCQELRRALFEASNNRFVFSPYMGMR